MEQQKFEIVHLDGLQLRLFFLDNEKWYPAIDLYRILGYRDRDANRIRASSEAKKVVKMDSNKITLVNRDGVRCFLLSSRKKTNSTLNKYFDIDINNSSLLCKESQIGTALSKAFKEINIISQYKVNNEDEMYYIDYYLPDHRIAIEIDEHAHNDKGTLGKKQDVVRQNFIERKLGCIFIRCNPDTNTFDFFDLIYQIRMKLINNTQFSFNNIKFKSQIFIQSITEDNLQYPCEQKELPWLLRISGISDESS